MASRIRMISIGTKYGNAPLASSPGTGWAQWILADTPTISSTIRPRAGIARRLLARPATTTTPRPVCPTSRPSGNAMIRAISTASRL